MRGGLGEPVLLTDEGREQVYLADSDYSGLCAPRPLHRRSRIALQRADAEPWATPSSSTSDWGARHRASIKVKGEVRHAASADDGSVSAGIEFTEVGDLERALLFRLVRDLEVPERQTA